MGRPQTFRSPTSVLVWVVWLLFAVANWVDLAVQGRDHASLVAAAILLLGTGIAYACAQRPRIIADDGGLTIRNPLRDHRVTWPTVTKVDLTDLLRVHADWGPGRLAGPAAGQPGRSGDLPRHQGERAVLAERPSADAGARPERHARVISSWAVHYSRRRQLVAEARARRAGSRAQGGLRHGSSGLRYAAPAPAAAAPEAEAEKVARVLTELADAGAGGVPAPVRSTWDRAALAAIVIPAGILVLVCLL